MRPALALVVALTGCGRIGFDDQAAAVCAGTISIAPGTTTHEVSLCAGTSTFTVARAAGERITATLRAPAAELRSVSLELQAPDGSFMAGPVWGPDLVETTALVGESGGQQIVVESDRDTLVTLDVLLAPAAGNVFHIAPAGDDTADGSEQSPWRSWPQALARLMPGDTLVAHDGTWATNIDANCTTNTRSGLPGMPVTILARHSRRARISGDGSAAAVRVDSCAHWIVDGIYATSVDQPTSSLGSVFSLRFSPGIVARNLLAVHANPCVNSAAIELGGSEAAVLEDSEVYDYPRTGVTGFDTTARVTARRVYAHSRNAPTPCGSMDAYPTRGDASFQCYAFPATAACRFENVFAENSSSGVADAESQLLTVTGSIARDVTFGIFASAKSMPPPARTSPIATEHFVCLDCEMGIWNRGMQIDVNSATLAGGRARTSSSYGVGGAADENGGTTARTTFRHVLALDNERRGFSTVNQQSLLIRSSNAFGNAIDYDVMGATEPIDDDAGVIQRSSNIEPTGIGDTAGNCLVYVPADSNMATAGDNNAPIGATVIYRIVDGVTTDRKLWNQRTGQFPCGAIVAGVNDVPGASCFDAHTRVRVGVEGCAIP